MDKKLPCKVSHCSGFPKYGQLTMLKEQINHTADAAFKGKVFFVFLKTWVSFISNDNIGLIKVIRFRNTDLGTFSHCRDVRWCEKQKLPYVQVGCLFCGETRGE